VVRGALPRFCFALIFLSVVDLASASVGVVSSSPPYQVFIPSVYVPPPTPVSSVIYRDDFSDPSSGWPISDTTDARYDYNGGEYQILLRSSGDTAIAESGFSGSNVNVQVDARLATTSPGIYGILLDVSPDGNSFYLFTAEYVGSSNLYRVVNGVWTRLSAGGGFGGSQLAQHHLTAVRSGSLIDGYVDGVLTVSADDSTLSEGRVGLAAQTFSFQSNVDARFDNFVVQNEMSWATRADMPAPRSYFGAAASNGMIYTFGGTPPEGGPALNTVEAFDPVTNSWTERAQMPTGRFDAGVVTAADGSIYVIGGEGSDGGDLNTVERYDPVSNTWTPRAPMPTARSALGVVRAENGKIYAIGGSRYDGSTQVATVEIYDPTNDAWTTGPSLPEPDSGFAAVVGPDRRIYVFGGCCSALNPPEFDTVEALDPWTNSWSVVATTPSMFLRPSAVTALNNKIYIVGGGIAANNFVGSGGSGGHVEEYNPLNGTWTFRATSPYSDGSAAVLTSNGKIEILGACARYLVAICQSTEEGTIPAPGTLTESSRIVTHRSSSNTHLLSAP